VARPHGLTGEVVVELVTNLLERLAPGARLTVSRSGLPPPSSGPAPERSTGDAEDLVVVSSRPFQHRHLVQFSGICSRVAAESLRGAVLLAPPVQDPQALFVHELIGTEVTDTAGCSHGLVVAVEANPASDLLVGEEGWLVPLRFVVERRGNQVIVDVPDGLFE
jgi:16S rRNA processing protein RimM